MLHKVISGHPFGTATGVGHGDEEGRQQNAWQVSKNNEQHGFQKWTNRIGCDWCLLRLLVMLCRLLGLGWVGHWCCLMLCDVLLFRDFWFVLLSGEADSQRGKNMQSWCHLLWQQLIYSSQLQVSSNLGGPSRTLRSDTPRPTCCYFAQMPPFGRFGRWEQLGNVLKTGCLHFTMLGDNDNYTVCHFVNLSYPGHVEGLRYKIGTQE